MKIKIKECRKLLQKRVLSPKQQMYAEFFFDMLDEFGVESPSQLSDEKKAQFFNKIKSGWKNKKRTKAYKEIDVPVKQGMVNGIRTYENPPAVINEQQMKILYQLLSEYCSKYGIVLPKKNKYEPNQFGVTYWISTKPLQIPVYNDKIIKLFNPKKHYITATLYVNYTPNKLAYRIEVVLKTGKDESFVLAHRTKSEDVPKQYMERIKAVSNPKQSVNHNK